MNASEAPVLEGAQFLSFFIAGEEYAVGILQVKEIIQYTTVTKVPSMPASIRGVINLRGKAIPVIDLAARFGLGETAITKWTCIVVVEVDQDGEKATMGLLADAVSQVIDLKPEEIEPPPSFGTRIRVDYLRGMGKTGKKFALLLALDRVLAAQELLSNTLAAAAAQEPAPAPAEPAAEPAAAPTKAEPAKTAAPGSA